MESKVVVVTGGSSGIGAAIAVHLCEIGYRKLVIVARREDKLREVSDQCKSKGDDVDVLILALDLSLAQNNVEVVRKTLNHFGRLDILINNVGFIGEIAEIENNSLENFTAVINTNLVGPFVISKESLPHIKEARGSIIFVASIYGTSPQPGWIQYNTSKAALKMLAKIFALETAAHGVRVNILSPGYIDTEIIIVPDKSTDEQNHLRSYFASRTPMGRIGESLEMAKLCAFLISDQNTFMTGSDVISDGGFLLTSKDPN